MALQAQAFDLTSSAIGLPKTLAYGVVHGSGNRIVQFGGALPPAPNNSSVLIHLLGEGPWEGYYDGAVNLWTNRAAAYLPYVHFHPGIDGEIGTGMAPTSTGGDNHVTDIWQFIDPSIDVTTFSRYAYLAILLPPDPAWPGPDFEVIGNFKAMKCRIYDNVGNQTDFAWTVNPAWWILDYHIRKFVLREGKTNQPLVAAERARIDFQSFYDASVYFDADIGGGIPRFSDGGLVFVDQGLAAADVFEQLLLMCRSYLIERNGILSLYADQPRAPVFTFNSNMVQADSLKIEKTNLLTANNRIVASWRELSLADGSTDDGTRFAVCTKNIDNEAHQFAIGTRGPGMAVIPKVLQIQLDYGVNTAERVVRLANFQRIRQLGDDVDVNGTYLAPQQVTLVAFEDSAGFRAIKPGDVVELHRSLSEEVDGLLFEVLNIQVNPDGSRQFNGLEYEPDAFTDSSDVQQSTQAPVPGTGLPPPFILDGNNDLVVPLDQTIDAGDRYAPTIGITLPTDLPYNPSFEIWPDTVDVADGWTKDWAGASSPAAAYSRNSSTPFAGVYAQSIDNSGGAAGRVDSRPFGIKEGLTYELAVRVKANAPNVGNLYATALFFVDDSDFSYAGWVAQGSMYASAVSAYTANSTGWTRWAADIVAPAGAKFCRIGLLNSFDGSHGGAGSPGILSFDTCTFRLEQISSVDAALGSTVSPYYYDTGVYQTLAEMTKTVQTHGGDVLLSFYCGRFFMPPSTGLGATIDPVLLVHFYRDGSQIDVAHGVPCVFSSVALTWAGAGNPICPGMAFSFVDPSPPAGSHTYDVRIAPVPDYPHGYDVQFVNTERGLQVTEIS